MISDRPARAPGPARTLDDDRHLGAGVQRRQHALVTGRADRRPVDGDAVDLESVGKREVDGRRGGSFTARVARGEAEFAAAAGCERSPADGVRRARPRAGCRSAAGRLAALSTGVGAAELLGGGMAGVVPSAALVSGGLTRARSVEGAVVEGAVVDAAVVDAAVVEAVIGVVVVAGAASVLPVGGADSAPDVVGSGAVLAGGDESTAGVCDGPLGPVASGVGVTSSSMPWSRPALEAADDSTDPFGSPSVSPRASVCSAGLTANVFDRAVWSMVTVSVPDDPAVRGAPTVKVSVRGSFPTAGSWQVRAPERPAEPAQFAAAQPVDVDQLKAIVQRDRDRTSGTTAPDWGWSPSASGARSRPP